MKRLLLITAAIVIAAVGLASAAVFTGTLPSEEPTAAPSVVEIPDDVAEVEPTGGATVEDAPAPATTQTATPTPTTTPEESEGPDEDVAAVQEGLAELGYYTGPVDGSAGPATASAVQAFQKVHGLVADGVIGPNTVAALTAPVTPSLRGGPSNRVEVDLDKQVMYLVEGGSLTRILPISSGSGESYAQPSGGSARSVTPVGSFTVQRNIRGVRNAPLGTLYDPMYFYGGWAIHGSNSVPSYPASHGCVRVTRADATWLFDRLPIGTTVEIYGNTNAFSPSLGETAGTDTPAGDTADTTPDDGIQTEEPTPESSPTATPPPAPEPATPDPVTPDPVVPDPVTPAPSDPGPSTPATTTSPAPQPSTPASPTASTPAEPPPPASTPESPASPSDDPPASAASVPAAESDAGPEGASGQAPAAPEELPEPGQE